MNNEPNGRPYEFQDDSHFWPQESDEDLVTDKEREIYRKHLEYHIENVAEQQRWVYEKSGRQNSWLYPEMTEEYIENMKRDLEEMNPRKIRIFHDGAMYLEEWK